MRISVEEGRGDEEAVGAAWSGRRYEGETSFEDEEYGCLTFDLLINE